MNPDTWEKLHHEFTSFPMMVAEGVARDEIDAAAGRLGVNFCEEYEEFLERYGAAMVNQYPVLGLRQAEVMGNDAWSVLEVTQRFRDDGWPGGEAWYIVSIDGAGNPIGLDPSGRVLVSDHNVGSIEEVAESFERFLVGIL